MKKINFLVVTLFLLILPNTFQAQELIPGDGVRVSFYNVPDQISGDYYIQKDNTLQLPFLEKIHVANENFKVLETKIISRYRTLYKDPELSIQPLFRVSILGEVRSPGYFYVTGVEKLSDLIAMAGGLTQDADINDINIIRKDKVFNIDGEEIIENGDKLNDIGLQSGDRIFVTRSWWVSARNSTIIISSIAVLISIFTLLKK